MGGSKLFFGDNCLAVVTSVEELEQALSRVRQGFDPPNPTLALVHANQNRLEISVSPQGCYLQYKDASGVPPFFSSVGNRALPANSDLQEFHPSKDTPTKIARRNLVPYDEMLHAAQFFVSTGVWPNTILEWEMIERA
jgi:hypothetical protein